jgi:hypothetical protein
MLANPALPAPRGLFAPRIADVQTHAEVVPQRVIPRSPWVRNHRTFRGTRILTAAVFFWAGAILVAFGALVTPAAHDLGRGDMDAGLMALLATIAPWVTLLGTANVVAAWGIARDRGWWLRLALWVLAAGVFVVMAGAVFAVAGRDPFLLTDPAPASPAGQGLAILGWTLALYGVAAWGVRRIALARRLLPTGPAAGGR